MKGLIFFLLTIISITVVEAQTSKPTKLYAKAYKDSIALRWHPYDVALWDRNIKIGYDIYRKSSNGAVVKINDSTIKALNPEQFALRYLKRPANIDTTKDDSYYENLIKENYKPDSTALKAMLLQFPQEVGFDYSLPAYKEGDVLDFGSDKEQIRWLFHILACLSSKEAAIVSGLYFVDKKVDPKEKYTYYVTTAGEPVGKALASTSLSASETYAMKTPKIFTDFTNKRRSVITWKKTDTMSVWVSVYDVFRSDKKNGDYVKINKKEVLSVYTGDNQRDSTIMTYSDSTIKKKQIYFYKVRAMDIFGDYSEVSEAYKVTEKTLIEISPFIEETKKTDNPSTCSVKWRVEAQEVDNVFSFQVYRSRFPDSAFAALSEVLAKDKRDYTDKKPSKNNYYKVLTVGEGGDSLWSSPAFIQVPDSIPPKAATMLEAICDSNGVVKITWKHHGEQDLTAFKLYRSNYQHEEFSRVAAIERVDTVYYDTLSLQTLTEQAYYKILAYDDSYNPSPFSNVIKAKRYDIIPPTFPVFSELSSDSTGIHLTWGNSSSEDVIKTVLYRKLKDESSWHEYKTFGKDTLKYTSFVDNDTYKGQWYEYTLQAFDDDQLVSGYTPSVQLKAYDNGVRPELQKVSNKLDKRKKINKLKWVYPHSGVELFQVFRATGDGPLTILKSVEPSQFEFYDTELTSGRTYHYRIKAVYKDGGESPFSKDLIVEF